MSRGLCSTIGDVFEGISDGIHALRTVTTAGDVAGLALVAKAAEVTALTEQQCRESAKKHGVEKRFNDLYNQAMTRLM